MRTRIVRVVSVIQSILFLTHLFIYETCVFFWQPADPGHLRALRIAMIVLSLSFVSATLIAFRFYNFAIRIFYALAAVWLGLLDFLFLASVAAWITFLFSLLLPVPLRQHVSRPCIWDVCLSLAVLTVLYGIVNAAIPRVQRISVKLPGLPPSWVGRSAVFLTDTHLGHIRNRGFLERIVAKTNALRPDVVFFSGDMFDGTKADLPRLVEPWKKLSPSLGAYFVTGNHEEFTDPVKFTDAVASTGIRVLTNEKVIVDGLQILGVAYSKSTWDEGYTEALTSMHIDRGRASVLLLHVPTRLAIAEQQGVSLQLSGHTHGGQIFPFTWFTWRVFGKYIHGLQQFGKMAVFTSYGAGTWGPPLRVGTSPEIVLIHFE